MEKLEARVQKNKAGGGLKRPLNGRWISYLFNRSKWLNFLWLNVGTLLISMGVYFFKFPNSFNTGGVSGLAVVLAKWYPSMSPSVLMFILNTILLVIGYLIFGKSFGFKTAYSSNIMSVMIWGMEKLYPIAPGTTLTGEPLLELIFAVLLPGIGGAILFNIHASNGGTDIVGMILKKYTSLNIGTALGLADLSVTMLSFFAFGPAISLFSVLGLVIKGTVIDTVIESINLHKYYTIITDRSPEVIEFITKKLKRSATITHAEGAFTGESKVIIMTVLKRSQGLSLQQFIHETDPTAFLFITNTSEIIGKGFGGTN